MRKKTEKWIEIGDLSKDALKNPIRQKDYVGILDCKRASHFYLKSIVWDLYGKTQKESDPMVYFDLINKKIPTLPLEFEIACREIGKYDKNEYYDIDPSTFPSYFKSFGIIDNFKTAYFKDVRGSLSPDVFSPDYVVKDPFCSKLEDISDKETIETMNIIVEKILERFGSYVERIILCGSRARGDHEEFSDYDVLVLGRFENIHCPKRAEGLLDSILEDVFCFASIIILTEEEFENDFLFTDSAKEDGIIFYDKKGLVTNE